MKTRKLLDIMDENTGILYVIPEFECRMCLVPVNAWQEKRDSSGKEEIGFKFDSHNRETFEIEDKIISRIQSGELEGELANYALLPEYCTLTKSELHVREVIKSDVLKELVLKNNLSPGYEHNYSYEYYAVIKTLFFGRHEFERDYLYKVQDYNFVWDDGGLFVNMSKSDDDPDYKGYSINVIHDKFIDDGDPNILIVGMEVFVPIISQRVVYGAELERERLKYGEKMRELGVDMI